jgi:hypothetical protein
MIDAPDTAAYYRGLMRFTALLRDGHSNACRSPALENAFYARPDARTAKVEGDVIVLDVTDNSLQSQLQVGAQIVSIDGIEANGSAL